MGVRDLAKKIAESRASGGGNHVRDGRGVCIIKSLKHEDLYKGETFIAELLVESSENLPEAKNADGSQIQANAPGSSFGFLQQFEEYPDTAFGNTKSFILTLMGEADSSPEDFAVAYEKLVGPQQPARGMRIRYETHRKLSKKSGISLVLPRWETVPQTVEQIAATRAKMDATTVS